MGKATITLVDSADGKTVSITAMFSPAVSVTNSVATPAQIMALEHVGKLVELANSQPEYTVRCKQKGV